MSTSAARRLGPDERRAQLVATALDLLKSRPFDEISPDDVARAAGVSKALVFHYFASKRDLQVAALRAAAGELLERLEVGADLPPDRRLGAGLDAYVRYIEQHPENYVAISRSAGTDPQLRAVFEETRSAVVQLILDAIGLPDAPPGLRLITRGWVAMVEETVLYWLGTQHVPREQLLDFLRRAAVTMLPDALATFADPA
jgi:AcrR family transcriptional regulator